MELHHARALTDAVDKLSMVTDREQLTRIVVEAARDIGLADGVTFALREGEEVFYADESSEPMLWKGRRNPLRACASGWSMLHRESILLSDFQNDPRLPNWSFRPPEVKSLCVVPIRRAQPLGALGIYWLRQFAPNEIDLRRLEILANSAAIAIENLAIKRDVINHPGVEYERALHTVAHDLRNPLSTMMLLTELLEDKLADKLDEDARDYFDSILATGKQASAQIQRMLTLYSANRAEPKFEPLDLSRMAREVSQRLLLQFPGRRVNFQIEEGLEAWGDAALMPIALDNLIGNAFKYTSRTEAPTIEFRRDSEDSWTRTFFIRDNGAGFPAEQAGELFQPLVRLHDPREFPGIGLGLVSVARIVGLHGGRVKAEGQPGHGAAFYFSLPKSAPRVRA